MRDIDENVIASATDPFERDVFEYLCELRESGVTNMFGAAAYIEDEFGTDKYQARDLLMSWMKAFDNV